jgi:hypothetical protein
MSNTTKAYDGMGSILSRLPFVTSLKSVYSSSISEEEQDALNRALQASFSTLMRARQYYQLDDDAVEACAAGFATELTRIVIGSRQEHQQPVQTMHVDGHDWELVFDPGPRSDRLRTDESGRVWRKVVVPDSDELPF